MTGLRSIVSRLKAMFSRQELDERIDEELRFHIEMQTEENMRRGMPEEEARRQALIETGGTEQVKEMHRAARGLPILEALLQDVRFALRSLRKNTGVTASALITLTLGVGMGSAIFSVVNAVLIRPLPYEVPDRLVIVERLKGERVSYTMPIAEFFELERSIQSFEAVGAFEDGWAPVITSLDPPERVVIQPCGPGFLSVLGVQPLLGRTFSPEEERQGEPVLILQHEIWRRRFNRDRNIIGKAIRLSSGPPRTVIGVMPPDFLFYNRTTDMLIPLPWVQVGDANNSWRWFGGVARLKPGITLGQAQAEADVFSRAYDQQRPSNDRGYRFRLTTISEFGTTDFRPALLALLGAVTGLILIMCANFANLLFAKTVGRTKELTVRVAMGASRGRLVRLLLTESLLLSLAGCISGLILCTVLLPVLKALVPDRHGTGQWLIHFQSIDIDHTVFFFALGASLCAGLVFGLLPAIRCSRLNLNEHLKDSATSVGAGRASLRLRRTLAVAQVAVSLVLAVGAVLLVRSVDKLYARGPGFQADRLLHLHVRWPQWALDEILPGTEASREERTQAQAALSHSFFQDVFARIRAVPGVTAVSSGIGRIGVGVPVVAFTIEDFPGRPDRDSGSAYSIEVTDGHFRTMGIPLLSGRAFEASDRPDTLRVAVVNQEAAARFWQGNDPIGKFLKRGKTDSANEWIQIVGVAGNVRYAGLDQQPSPAVYTSAAQSARSRSGHHLVVRTEGSPRALAPAVVAAIQEANRAAVVRDVREVQGYVDDTAWNRRLAMHLLAGLAGLALLLAAVGIFGVLSHMVGERRRDIGIRMALGAEKGTVLTAVIGQGLVIGSAGLALGLLLTVALTRFLQSLLFGVEPLDLIAIAISAGALFASIVLASYLPARQAAKIHPMMALRHE